MVVLAEKKCQPCGGIGRAYTEKEARDQLNQLEGWELFRDKVWKIKRQFSFSNFKEALTFANKVGELAEQENHHPDILIHSYRCVLITLYTHALHGLTENDFILAAKIDMF